MTNYSNIYTSTNNETYEFKIISRKKNSAYETEPAKTFTFKGRVANTQERSKYRLQLGVNVNADSLYIFATNLPEDIKPGDRIIGIGLDESIESVGYYYDLNGIVNASLFSEDYIIARCPKGITISKG